MKKLTGIFFVFTILLCAAMVLSLFSACGSTAAAPASESAETAAAPEAPAQEAAAEETPAADEPLQIVTTIFPLYDWVREILGERADGAEITMLLGSGVDLHSYQPTVDDIIRISNCDVFLYVGGESDGWADDALAESANPDRKAINLLDVLGGVVKEEEVVEGMEAEEHDHEHEEEEEGEEHDHEHEEGEVEYDEHVWLSLRNAQALCGVIADTLAGVDPDHADEYQANAEAYCAKLAALDEAYTEAVAAADVKTVVFGDRFPFRYMVDDYGLEYYAAFVGCSAESEASFETIVFLANKIDELGLTSILQIESADGSIAETIRSNTQSKDQQILTMDSLQSTTTQEVEAGATYLAAMEENLAVLKTALSR